MSVTIREARAFFERQPPSQARAYALLSLAAWQAGHDGWSKKFADAAMRALSDNRAALGGEGEG